MVMNAEFEGCDMLLAVAGLAEVDLSSGYNRSVVAAKNLGSLADMPESLWHVSSKSTITGRMEECIVQVSVVDALAEPAGCIWVLMEVPSLEEGRAEVDGVPIPPPQKRQDAGLTAFRLRPLGDGAFALQMSVSVPNASAVAMVPAFALKRIARMGVQQGTKAFRKYITINLALPERVSNGPRADFYCHLQHHLDAHRS